MNAGELVNLLKEYRKHSSASDKGKQVKTQVIEKLSSSYWWNSQYIINFFSEKVREVQQDLQKEIDDKFQLIIKNSSSLKQLADYLIKEALILHKKYQISKNIKLSLCRFADVSKR